MWTTYFQPLSSGTKSDGTAFCCPDLGEVDEKSLTYWSARAMAAKHPVLVARYSDLVWDVAHVVLKLRRGRDAIDHARRAIDAYLAAARIDDGAAWLDTVSNLSRALKLAMGIKDAERTRAAVTGHLEYVERTADDDKVGTYCYLFDNLLPLRNGPLLTLEQERFIVALFESKLSAMTSAAGRLRFHPHGPESVGACLAAYYERKGRKVERARVLRLMAEAFERGAVSVVPLVGLVFLGKAREHYAMAGLRKDAERVASDAERLGPEAAKRCKTISVSCVIPGDRLEEFLRTATAGGREQSLERLAVKHIPDQGEIGRCLGNRAGRYPVHGLLAARPMIMGSEGIRADVGDSTGDPDGVMVYETAQALQLQAPWIGWILQRLVRDGLTAEHVLTFVLRCPLYTSERHALLRQGISAYFNGDHVQAIHILVPQIEYAIVRLAPLTGSSSTKQHRTGRGVMQSKNLNDILTRETWPVGGPEGENLRMYFLSALAHPKGLNIRNEVCHGLWSAELFTQQASERVLHLVLTVSLLRETDASS